MKEVFVLLADGDGTTRSIDEPWGAAVKTKTEAKQYVERGGIGYTHSYAKVKIFDSYEEAREAIYGDLVRKYEGAKEPQGILNYTGIKE